MNALTLCRFVWIAVGVAQLVAQTSPFAASVIVETTADPYELQPIVVGAGGARMQGTNALALDGTVGQAAALVENGGAGLRLDGGFWRSAGGTTAISDRIFANGFE